jgi:hypothetical protein
MALAEQQVNDKIEIINGQHVQVRCATIIERDGVEISRTFHRHVIAPGQDYSNESAEVKAICSVVHTDETIAAYHASLQEV